MVVNKKEIKKTRNKTVDHLILFERLNAAYKINAATAGLIPLNAFSNKANSPKFVRARAINKIITKEGKITPIAETIEPIMPSIL